MWNLLNPLDPTYSYGNRVHVQRRVHACGSDSNRAQSSACMRDLACNLSASFRASSPAIGRRVAVARGVQRVSWYGGPVAGAARCSVGSEPFLHRILYSGLAASHRGAVKRSDWHTRSEEFVRCLNLYTTFHIRRGETSAAAVKTHLHSPHATHMQIHLSQHTLLRAWRVLSTYLASHLTQQALIAQSSFARRHPRPQLSPRWPARRRRRQRWPPTAAGS